VQHKDDLEVVKKLIAALAPGRHTMKEIYGDLWEGVRRKRACGWWFKRAVDAGRLPRLRWVRKRSNKSNEYEVLPR